MEPQSAGHDSATELNKHGGGVPMPGTQPFVGVEGKEGAALPQEPHGTEETVRCSWHEKPRNNSEHWITGTVGQSRVS